MALKDLENNKPKQEEPWEYVNIDPPLVPTVEAGPDAETWRKLTTEQQLALIRARHPGSV
jgi:hypothetical protein